MLDSTFNLYKGFSCHCNTPELDFSNEFRLSHSLRYSYFPNIFSNADLILLYLCIHHTFSNRRTNFGPFFTLFYD